MEWKRFAGKCVKGAVFCGVLAGMLVPAACGKAQGEAGVGEDVPGIVGNVENAGDNRGQGENASTVKNGTSVEGTDENERNGGDDGQNGTQEITADMRENEVPGANGTTPVSDENTLPETKANEDGLWGLEHLEKYVKPEEMGEYALSSLRWMAMWCDSEYEGSFILDGFGAKEEAVVEQIREATGKIACWILQRDFDGDGREEAFAYVSDLCGNGGIEVYFAAADGSVQMLMENNTYSGQTYFELPGNTFYVCSIAGADMMSYYMYEVDGNEAKPAALQGYYGMELLENGRICVWDSCGDAFSSPEDYDEFISGSYAGRTYRDYYYEYDGENFYEYSGVPITEEEFCQYEGGAEILGEIRENGNVIRSIYYFGDGRMIVNYVEKDAVMDASYGGLVRHNYYLQVPIISEGECGFVLLWDASCDVEAMQKKHRSSGEQNVFVREGVYAPVLHEDLARYPEYQTPEEYKEREGERKRQKAKLLLNSLNTAWCKNLEKLIALEEIGEGGLHDLEWKLISWKKEGMEGSCVLDGLEEADQMLAERLAQESEKIPCWIIRRDFDGDGKTEAFVLLFDLRDESMSVWDDNEIWFAASDGTLQLVEQDVNPYQMKCLELEEETFFVYRVSSNFGEDTRMCAVNGNETKIVGLNYVYGLERMEDGRVWMICQEGDAWNEPGHYGETLKPNENGYISGSTYKYYYYGYGEDGLYEYSGVPVTEEEFCQYENGEEILRAIRARHMLVKDIYYFADGRMVVNFTEGNIGYEGRPRSNYYLQVPMISQGQDGFVLAWNDFFGLEELFKLDVYWDDTFFMANGIYRPAYHLELARYPEFSSPLEYYKKQYKGLNKKSLKICTVQENVSQKNASSENAEEVPGATDMQNISTLNIPIPGEVLADGSDLAAIEGDGSILRFVPDYDTAALLAQAGTASVGIWIDGEYIGGGSLKNGQQEMETVNFWMAGTQDHSPVYQDCLIYFDNPAAKGSYRTGTQVKLRAFAQAAGLWKGSDITEIREAGRVYESGQDYRIDLNGDGVKDVLRFENGSIWVNGRDCGGEILNKEAVDTSAFILCDIDTGDGIFEIGLWEPGTGPEGRTGVYWYDGSSLQCAGSVEGLWSEDGPAVKYLDDAAIRVKSRLHILQVWWTEKTFRLDEEHNIVEDTWDDLYYTEDYQPLGFRYEVLKPIRIYTEGDKYGAFAIVAPGDRFFVMHTDDKNYITVEPEHAPFGRLYLEDGVRFERPEGGFYEKPEEVIAGLRLE